MDNPLVLIAVSFASLMAGLFIGYVLGVMQRREAVEAALAQARARARAARGPAAAQPAVRPVAAPRQAMAQKWPNPPTRVIEVPSRMVDAMSKETGALDLNKDGNVALKVSTMTTNGQTRYTLRNEEEGVTHEFDRLEDVPAQWRPLVDRFLAGQREIFGGKQQIPRPSKKG